MEGQKKSPHGLWGFLRVKGRIWILLLGALCGIVLIALGGTLGTQEQIKENATAESLAELQAYQTTLEKELEAICEEVVGVSQVEVLVRLESGSRTIYATDENGKPSTVGSGSGQSALYSTLLPPKVAGVGIVCRGGNDPAVQRRLTDLVSTTLGISAARVCVMGK